MGEEIILEPRELLDILTITERLKDTTRHCYTSKGRRESVAEHTWMMTLMALLLTDEFPDVDMNKVIKMCLIHDLGECFTGDIPTFEKQESDEEREERLLYEWLETLPEETSRSFKGLFDEMKVRETKEAKVFKAMDSLEAVVQHNLSDISTWEDHEYELNLTYGTDKVAFSDYLVRLREEMKQDTLDKIAEKETRS